MRDTKAHRAGYATLHTWGARSSGTDAWSFAVWAPGLSDLTLVLEGRSVQMHREPDGIHRCRAKASERSLYHFLSESVDFAEPASLRQSGGVESRSRLLSGPRLANRKSRRARPSFDRQVITELHFGTFTADGTLFTSARAAEPRRIAELGIMAIEVMPLGQFPGERG